ncbi:MAG: DNA mismatch repair protein MutS [Dethiobacteria bacterium]
MKQLTPMMQQYKKIKDDYPDTILFFRVGDFYEMFFEDAVTASRELEIALTSRDGNKEDRVPLAGVPYHAAQNYLSRLLAKGYKVAICDQVEEADQAKGLVRREVTRVITPGTIVEDNLLEKNRSNYLAAIVKLDREDSIGLTFIDISTGELLAFHFEQDGSMDRMLDELFRLKPSEIVLEKLLTKIMSQDIINRIKEFALINQNMAFSDEKEARDILSGQFSEKLLINSGIKNSKAAQYSTALGLKYIKKMQNNAIAHIDEIKFYREKEFLRMDAVTMRNLEITETIHSRDKKNSLLGILDRTRTSMGARLLRKWLEMPLLNKELIEQRWNTVGEFKEKLLLKEDLGGMLGYAYDLERLSARINMGLINPRDLLALKKTLLLLPQIKGLLESGSSKLLCNLKGQIPDLSLITEELHAAIKEDAPVHAKDGGIFKDGYSIEIDELRTLSRNSKSWLLEFEKREKERTGIKSLKVRYNKIFGYYIDITKANIEMVPPDYIRKQTLVNSERFVTRELKEKEALILNADERLARIEYALFEELRLKLASYTKQLQAAGKVLANLDCIYSLADAAAAYGYSRPDFSSNNAIIIKESRHPVVERNEKEPFIANDLFMDNIDNRVLIITGPNMAGKSTYCRSAALLLLMAQAGSFVPAEEMSFTPVDQIFARVGASDDLSSGRSTFMVEMEETASIIKEATPNSLVILDEIGRGTSTYDGMSLAQAILEYLHDEVKAKVLFSTHYHELTPLETKLHAVKNYTVSVKEQEDKIIFLRKIIPGKADKSYGINVARLAGLPDKIITNAGRILKKLEGTRSLTPDNQKLYPVSTTPFIGSEGQLSLVPSRAAQEDAPAKKEKKILEEIKRLNIVDTTPLEALNILFSLQSRLLSKKEELHFREKES